LTRFLVTKLPEFEYGAGLFTVLYLKEPTIMDRRLLAKNVYDWDERAKSGAYGAAYHDMSPIRYGFLLGHPASQRVVELREADESRWKR
jgi:hypothetical protein